MASNVSSAVGTQRQFAPQPKDTYQKQLIVASGNTTAGAGTKAQRLANALGLWSDTLMKEAPQEEARNEKYAKLAAETAKNDPTNAGQTIISNQQMLANAGLEKYADNPYTLAALARYRGAIGRQDMWNRFQEEVVNKEPPCKTAEEARQRWIKFAQEHYSEYVNPEAHEKATEAAETNGDTTAPNAASSLGVTKPLSSFKTFDDTKFFNMGFFENFDVCTQREIDKQIQLAADNRKALRTAAFTAELSNLVSPETVSVLSPEELQGKLKEAVDNVSLAASPLSEWYPILAKSLEDYVSNNGSTNMSALFDTPIYKGANGEMYRVRDLFPFETYHGAAIVMDAALRQNATVSAIESLTNCSTVAEFDNVVKGLDPHIKSALAKNGMLDNMRDAKNREIQRAQRQLKTGVSGAVATAVKQSSTNNFSTLGKLWFKAWEKRSPTFAGRPITSPLQITTVDAKGKPVTRNANADEIISLGNDLMNDILKDLADNKIDMKTATEKEMTLLTAPQMKAFRESFSSSVEATLNNSATIDWEHIDYNNHDMQNMQTVFNMMNANPLTASSIFDKDLYSRLVGLTYTTGLYDSATFTGVVSVDGLKQAMRSYSTVAATLQYGSDSRKRIDSAYELAIKDPKNRRVTLQTTDTDYSGNPLSSTIDMAQSGYIQDRVKPIAEILMARGVSGDAAVKQALDILKNTVYYNSSLVGIIPKDFCRDLPDDKCGKDVMFSRTVHVISYKLMDDASKGLKLHYGMNIGAMVYAAYDDKSRTVMFTVTSPDGKSTIENYDANKFLNEAEYVNEHWEEIASKSPDFEDNPTEELTSSTYKDRNGKVYTAHE